MSVFVFLDESGEFTSRSRLNYIGGWACEESDLPKALEIALPYLQRLQTLMPNPNKPVHMRELIRDSAHPHWHDAMEQYRLMMRDLLPITAFSVQYTVPKSWLIGPSEGWNRAVVGTLVEMISKLDAKPLTAFVSPRLQPIYDWVRESSYIDKHLELLKNWMREGVLEDTGIRVPKERFHFLTSFVNPEWPEIVRLHHSELQAMADAFCTGQWEDENPFFADWPEDKVWKFQGGKRLMVAESRQLHEDFKVPELQPECLYRLIEAGQEKTLEAIELMNSMKPPQWEEFCELIEGRFLYDLTYARKRYQTLLASQEFTDRLPVHVPHIHQQRLVYLQQRCRLRITSHSGGRNIQGCQQLQALVDDPMSSPFTTELERMQAQIDVLLDSVQHLHVNALEPDPQQPQLLSVLHTYKTMFPNAHQDRNLAALHGTAGQMCALSATIDHPHRVELLQQAREHFLLDQRYSSTPADRAFAYGYLALTDFLLGDLQALEKSHREECVLTGAYRDNAPLESCLKWKKNLLQGNVFAAVHHAQWLALRNRQSSEPAFFPEALDSAFMALSEVDATRYPFTLLGKWLAILALQADQSDKAVALLQRAQGNPNRKNWLAVDWFPVLENILTLEIQELNSGFAWFDLWRQEHSFPANGVGERFAQWIDGTRQESDLKERCWKLATALPFYYS